MQNSPNSLNFYKHNTKPTYNEFLLSTTGARFIFDNYTNTDVIVYLIHRKNINFDV